ncbi:MAG TPA: recombinase family protein [Candidatus Melainabacteria bacterium]|nr:recombinase family protein [Candidatus Melainabacteria bacterium]HIN64316.1 recombinase family protein [Candidatus Obscuribacterales bacterium]
MLIGYARVSKEDQNLELQIQALTDAGCNKIFSDKKSGAQKVRKGLEDALSHLRPGDTLIVWKLDRLGRTVKQLVDLVSKLESDGINFKSLTNGIDTTNSAGRFFFHIMASLAQMERELISERTKAGLEAGKRLGRLGGRRRLMTDGKIRSAKKLLKTGMPPREVAEDLGVSLATLYRWIPEAASVI